MITDTSSNDRFSVVRAADLANDTVDESWLIEHLWARAAVGLVGGQPKSLKSWLALEMAVSVATVTPCLGRYAVHDGGRSLIYLAEDSLPAVRSRLSALAQQRGLNLDDLDVHVITESSLRLDLARDQARLLETLRSLQPRFLVLDPLVRIQRIDENSSNEVSHFLAYLRDLQRQLDLAVCLVHHTRKSGAPAHAAGQSLRGSGDFHAWSDSGLYLKRQRGGDVLLTVEHRSHQTPDPFAIRLEVNDNQPLRLRALDPSSPSDRNKECLKARVLKVLLDGATLSRATIREQLAVKNERLGRALDDLETAQSIERTAKGWKSAQIKTGDRSRPSPTEMRGNGTAECEPQEP